MSQVLSVHGVSNCILSIFLKLVPRNHNTIISFYGMLYFGILLYLEILVR